MYLCTVVEMYKLICLGDRADKEDMSQMQMRFKSEGLPKNLVRIFLPAITHDSMYGALCTISVPNFSF